MDKYQLKEKLIAVADELNKLGGSLMASGCKDGETGNLRQVAMNSLENAHKTIHQLIYNIY